MDVSKNIKTKRESLSSAHSTSGSHSLTQDNFFKKVKDSRGFVPMSKSEQYGTIIQMMKSDLFQIQEMIKENSSMVKMYKLMSKSSNVVKKLNEIEDAPDIKILLEKIADDSGNIDKIARTYNCTNMTELVQKLSMELNYYELFIRKLNEYFFLLHLKSHGEDNLNQDSLSKILLIKLVVENILNKRPPSNVDDQAIFITKNDDVTITKEDVRVEYEHFLSTKTLEDIYNQRKETKLFTHVNEIFDKYIDKVTQSYNEVLNKYSESIVNDSNTKPSHEKPFVQRSSMEKILFDKDKELCLLKEENKNKTKEIENLREEIEKLIKANEGNANHKPEMKSEDITEVGLLKLLKECNNTIVNLNTNADTRVNKLEEELRIQNEKYEILEAKYSNAQIELTAIQRKVEHSHGSHSSDAYEQLLLEQFETMKNAFTEKVTSLTSELSKLKSESRRRINEAEEEIKQTKTMKDIFLKQVIELQKKLNI